ncbi:MAG: hypothetical protein BGO67_01800 [Alphaproteobacteria bacterium 41-28]|nr:MAG: hypothetical protein BGO67_01800 [Alphaproteobacteria bacterium 41-28]
MIKNIFFKKGLKVASIMILVSMIGLQEGWTMEEGDSRPGKKIGHKKKTNKEWLDDANRKLSDIQFWLGMKKIERGYYVEAHWWLEQAAKYGHLRAQYNVGILYQNGWGVSESQTNALNWFKSAKKGGHPKARMGVANAYYNMGIECYKSWLRCYKGENTAEVLEYFQKALDCFERAKKNGDQQAQEKIDVLLGIKVRKPIGSSFPKTS